MNHQNRPYIICHMLASINGRISGSFFGCAETGPAAKLYQTLHNELQADAVVYGRTTVDEVFTRGSLPDLTEYRNESLAREDYTAVTDSPYYLAVIDPEGTLGWYGPSVQGRGPGYDGAHVIEVLTEQVSDAYIAYLRQRKISYIFAGKKELIPKMATQKLYDLFGIQRILLQGGGLTNSTFIQCIDELSLVIAPATDCGSKNPTVFEDSPGKTVSHPVHAWKLCEVKQMEGSAVWMRYKKK